MRRPESTNDWFVILQSSQAYNVFSYVLLQRSWMDVYCISSCDYDGVLR